MTIVMGADHAGLTLKIALLTELTEQGYELKDIGTYDQQPVDYPDIARALGQVLQAQQADKGILICGSGVGASIAANKMKGIRAAVCHDTYSARQGVEHDDMNVLCLGSRVIGSEAAKEIVRAFLNAHFSHAPRHERRVAKVKAMEK